MLNDELQRFVTGNNKHKPVEQVHDFSSLCCNTPRKHNEDVPQKAKLSPWKPQKCGEVELQLHSFLTSECEVSFISLEHAPGAQWLWTGRAPKSVPTMRRRKTLYLNREPNRFPYRPDCSPVTKVTMPFQLQKRGSKNLQVKAVQGGMLSYPCPCQEATHRVRS
jgi:hypothetical protein